MDRWVGKVAVVTGASSGIGEATVHDLSAKGVIVVALARRKDKLKEVADSCDGKVYPIQCDLSNEQDILSAFSWIEEHLGGVDILINNAGVVKATPFSGGETSDWSTIWQTNVLALSICTREAMKTMRKRGDNGHIIHINSILGHYVPNYVPSIGMYSASKHAVTALTEALRLELQGLNSNIKVTSISPGSVYTEMIRGYVASITGTEIEPAGPVPPAHLEAKDVSEAILYCLGTRPLVQVHELMIQPIGQKLTN